MCDERYTHLYTHCHNVTPWRDCLDMWWIDCTDILSDEHISESNPSLFANMV